MDKISSADRRSCSKDTDHRTMASKKGKYSTPGAIYHEVMRIEHAHYAHIIFVPCLNSNEILEKIFSSTVIVYNRNNIKLKFHLIAFNRYKKLLGGLIAPVIHNLNRIGVFFNFKG